jgi:hypothetical protein
MKSDMEEEKVCLVLLPAIETEDKIMLIAEVQGILF